MISKYGIKNLKKEEENKQGKAIPAGTWVKTKRK